MFLTWIKHFWAILNKISPSNRNLLIMLLMGFIFYSQINQSTQKFLIKHLEESFLSEKKAEKYTKETAIEINHQVKLIQEKDEDAFDVLLLSYHNNTQSLQGYKYLYLSCLTEAPKSIDVPLLKNQWNNIDYVYYADELSKIHSQSFVQIPTIEYMASTLPKLYHLVKASDAESVTFFTIEGINEPVGMIVLLYKSRKLYNLTYPKVILPSIQRLAILLDYENVQKLK